MITAKTNWTIIKHSIYARNHAKGFACDNSVPPYNSVGKVPLFPFYGGEN